MEVMTRGRGAQSPESPHGHPALLLGGAARVLSTHFPTHPLPHLFFVTPGIWEEGSVDTTDPIQWFTH